MSGALSCWDDSSQALCSRLPAPSCMDGMMNRNCSKFVSKHVCPSLPFCLWLQLLDHQKAIEGLVDDVVRGYHGACR